METPSGQEFFLSDYTLPKLTETVIRQLAQFDSEKPGFTDAARAEAASLGYDWTRYVNLAIQHQVCMRNGGLKSGLCWGGTGDKIHEFMKGIDSFVASSGMERLGEKLTQVATKLATGKASKKLGGCASCGGRKTFAGNDKNLGRVAKLN